MLEYNGKYNKAIIMIDQVEEALVQQLYSFLNHPAFQNTKIVVMPDCHAGAGVCIGFTMTMNEMIVPNLCGVDIGCGVEVWNLGHHKKRGIKFEKLDSFVRENIPNGTGHINAIPFVNEKVLNTFLPGMFDRLMRICEKINLDKSKVVCSIGSLGSGNHYIEIDRAPNKDCWLNIHSGSRNFGLQVAMFHQQKARIKMAEVFKGASAFNGLEYLQDEDAEEYIADMKIAQAFASLNRKVMGRIILEQFFKLNPEEIEHIESVHNYISFTDNIIRKGAISAQAGERVVIPLNMCDGIVFAVVAKEIQIGIFLHLMAPEEKCQEPKQRKILTLALLKKK